MGFIDAFVGGVIVSLIALYVKNQYQEVEYVESKIDGKRYLVRRAGDSQEAADTLAKINGNIKKLIQGLKGRHPNDERTKKLRMRYDGGALSEGGHNSGYTSFSVNKGEKIVMCLRSRGKDENGDIEKFNTLMYVVLHELGHVITEDIGHTKTFWDNFRWLLDEAEISGVYEKIDYSKEPEQYCGMKINSTASTDFEKVKHAS